MAVHKLRKVPFNDHIHVMASSEGTITKHVQHYFNNIHRTTTEILSKLMPTDTGLKITAGHWTMSGQDDYLSRQNLGLAVILTGHVCIFQTIN